MPCNCDYMEPTELEKQLKVTTELLSYVCDEVGYDNLKFPICDMKNARDLKELIKSNTTLYPNDMRVVPALCAIMNGLTKQQEEKIVYDGRNKNARNLANWWELHQEADKQREAGEKAEKQREAIKATALAKLTPSERQALGLEC